MAVLVPAVATGLWGAASSSVSSRPQLLIGNKTKRAGRKPWLSRAAELSHRAGHGAPQPAWCGSVWGWRLGSLPTQQRHFLLRHPEFSAPLCQTVPGKAAGDAAFSQCHLASAPAAPGALFRGIRAYLLQHDL